MQREPIAIVGIGCRFPGAANSRQFWQLLREGRSAIREVPADRWQMDAIYADNPALRDQKISHWGGFIDQVDRFDWRFFHMSPREAVHVDPQHRLLLEVAWEALEDAGLPTEEIAGSRTSVAIGISWNDYLRLQSRNLSQLSGYTVVGNPYSFAANRISYTFDLRGPSVSLDAGCTSSLASIYYACQSLWTGEAELALAGGVNLILSPDSMVMMSQAGLLSPEGICKALDADANGCVRGEGAGIIVLKPLASIEPSDRVYALIHGVGLNHNGHNEWIMATSAPAQERLLREVYTRADIDPGLVDYVELHGTGFLRGDAVEAGALGATFGSAENRTSPCHIGSLKTNIGNLEAASGIASVIKVALSLFHGQMPPTLNLTNVNPAIDLSTLQLEAQRIVEDWPDSGVAPIAGINTISFTGANGHAILGGFAPLSVTRTAPEIRAELLPLTLSAKSEQALSDLVRAFQEFLTLDEQTRNASWQDICYTAAARRTLHRFRLTAYAHSCREAATFLREYSEGKTSESIVSGDDPARPATELTGHCVTLPTYPWQRERLWLSWLDGEADRAPLAAEQDSRPELSSNDVRGPQHAEQAILQQLRQVEPERQRLLAKMFVARQIASVLEARLDEADLYGKTLLELGIDSLTATQLMNRIQKDVHLTLSISAIFEYPTVEDLSNFIAGKIISSLSPIKLDAKPSQTPTSELDIAYVRDLSEAETEALLLLKFQSVENTF